MTCKGGYQQPDFNGSRETVEEMQKAPVVDEQEYTINDDKGVKSVLIRTKLGTCLMDVYSSLQNSKIIHERASHLLQTKDGQIAIVASDKNVAAVDLKNGKKIYEEPFTFVYYISLSPCQTFLQIFDKHQITQGRTTLLKLPQFKVVRVFEENNSTNFLNKENYPLIKFTSDERMVFRYSKKAIQIFNFELKQIGMIESGPLNFITLSKVSKENDFLLVSGWLDKKSNQGKIHLYNQTSLQKPIYSKNIDKAEQINVKFSPVCHDFLIQLQTYFDQSGKSYYGEYGLYFFNSAQSKMSRVKTYDGPIHDYSWDPKGERFTVISGFMPAGVVLFNNKNQPVFQFGKLSRNSINWSPQGRFLCLAGFGNLSGEMQIWDVPLTKKVGQCKMSSASYCQWSPDGRKIMAAIVTPRLRVDNCYKIFAYTGTLLKTQDFSNTQLYEVQWQNSLNEQYRIGRGPSPGRKIPDFTKKAQEKKFFRPMGSFIAAQILKAEMGKTEARMLTKNETFGVTKANQPKIQQMEEDKQPRRKKGAKDD